MKETKQAPQKDTKILTKPQDQDKTKQQNREPYKTRKRGNSMKDLNLRSLRRDKHKRFFSLAGSLPENDYRGKKGPYPDGDYEKFIESLDYIESFDPKMLSCG